MQMNGHRALVLVDHPAIRVLRALVDVLTTDERESNRPRVVVRGRGHRSADAAAVALLVGEAIPVGARRLEPCDEDAARPVRCFGEIRVRRRDDARERLILGDFNGQSF
jgi:hypothetical protein